MNALLLALALLLPFAAHAGQLTSDFRGQVVDNNGRVVPGAVMVVEAIETGRTTRHVANSRGHWHALGLRSDLTYRVSCFAPRATEPTVQFQGRVSLGQIHLRNCVLGTVSASSPSWLSSWQWRQAPEDRFVMR